MQHAKTTTSSSSWPHSKQRVTGAEGAVQGFRCSAAFQEADRGPVLIQEVLGPLP